MQQLQEWFNDNHPKEEMLWKDSFRDQIFFVRDKISGILARNYDQYKTLVQVYGTHTSKSITLPVYFIHLEQDGVNIWMRDNFHDWNVSIESDRPITCDFLGIFDDRNYDYCFCQGMENKKFGKYSESKFKFTVCIQTKYELYAFFWVLRTFLGIKAQERG